MKTIRTKQLSLTDLIKKKEPGFKCCTDKGMCAFYVPKGMPFEPKGRGLCEHPAIREQSNFFIDKQLKNGKTRRRKAEMHERPDLNLNMSECPGARWMYF
jgi:hypothetical protein